MSFSPLPAPWGQWLPALTAVLDPRSAPRLVRLLVGAVLATGRRTVTAWVRAAGLTAEFRPAYTTVAAAGRRADLLAAGVAHDVLKPHLAGADRLLLAVDDTPTERYGPKVQGAGVHHNPSRGRPGRRSSTATRGSSSGGSPGIRRGARSPSRSWPACTSGGRTCPASPSGLGRSSGPSSSWRRSWCGGPGFGSGC